MSPAMATAGSPCQNSRPGGHSSKNSNFHIHKWSGWPARKFMAVGMHRLKEK